MLNTKLTTLAVLITGIMIAGCNDSNDSNSGSNDTDYQAKAADIVAKMTGEEKIRMLIGPGFASDPQFGLFNEKVHVSGTVGWINGVYNEESGVDVAATRLMDGPAGIRIDPIRDGEPGTYYATTFPSASLLASSWNTELLQEVGAAAGEEGKEYGVDIWLAPGMNIQRNPLAGRNFEYYSEDPLIAGMMAAAMVNGAQSQGIGTTIKHFVANNSETNRRTVNAVVTPRAMREIYLRGFEYAVKQAQPWAIMTSYNSVNGTNVGERKDIVTNILRDEWGFKGLAMSDWWSGWNPISMIKAGVDVIEPGASWRIVHGENWLTYLQNAYAAGNITDADFNANVTRTLTQVLKTPSSQGYVFSNNPNLNAHIALSKAAAEEGIVLLQNTDSALPFASDAKVASFGIGQYATIAIGGGSGSVNSSYTSTIVDGLDRHFDLNPEINALYESAYQTGSELTGAIAQSASDYNPDKYCTESRDAFGLGTYHQCREVPVDTATIAAAAQASDVAVITIGRYSSESVDNEAGRNPDNLSANYMLNQTELDLVKSVAEQFHTQHKKVVVVLNVANAIDTGEWKDLVDGILLAYLPGQEAGNAIADIIAGVTNPSGKLAQTFPMAYADVPSSGTFPGKYVDSADNAGPDSSGLQYDFAQEPDFEQYYNEDVYVGYRYYHTFGVNVAFPFGHGLSYTTFAFNSPSVVTNTLDSQGAKGRVTLSATVANTGAVAGKQVAEVYVTAPEVKLKKPEIELKAFAKTETLAPNASQTLTFDIPAETLASFDEANNQWIVEPGEYKVFISSSSDVTGVEPITFNVAQEIVVEQTTPGAMALQSKYADKAYITVTE